MDKIEIDEHVLTLQYEELFSKGAFSQAIEIAQQMLDEAKQVHNYEVKANAYVKLMHCYYNLGEADNAFEMILKLRLLNEHVQFRLMDYYLEIIDAYTYDYEENYELAILHATKAAAIALELNNNYAIVISRNMLAHCLTKSNQHVQALEITLSNQKFIDEKLPHHLLLQAQCAHIMARAQIAQNLLEQAKCTLEKLSDNPIIAYNKKERSRYLYANACYYLQLFDYEKALSYFLKVETLAFQNNDIDLLRRVYKENAFIYAQINDYKTAFIQMKNYAHLLERVFQTNFSSKMNELSLKQRVLFNQRLANIDSLSTLFNRSYIEQLTNEWLQNNVTTEPICLILFDIDHFKKINDTYGHLYGDEAIKHIGSCCKKIFNDSSTVSARYGGDEFIVITQQLTLQEVIHLSQKLFTILASEKLVVESIELPLEISMGIVNTKDFPSKRFTQLFRLADQALYTAKSQGKNQIVTMTSIC